MIVPAATLLPAVWLFEFPAVAVVLNERIAMLGVQMSVLVDGFTLASTHVVETPVYE